MFKAIKSFFIKSEIRNKQGVLHFLRFRVIETSLFSIYIHYIARSDEDLHPHSHPWNFYSLILKGGYEETVTYKHNLLTEKFVKKIFNLGYRFYDDYHKIKLLKPTFTLVFCSKRNPNYKWGYLVDGDHMDHETYREKKNKNEFAK